MSTNANAPASNVRPAAVAGMFYPDHPNALRSSIESYLPSAPPAGQPPKVLIVPHAGYVYSGATAGAAFSLLRGAPVERVVLLGPAHRVYLDSMAVPECGAFTTPLGEIPVDAAMKALALTLPGVECRDDAHRLEHCLEVELPFLQTVLTDFTVLPVVVGQVTPERVAALLEALWGGPETLIVVSTDLSHFHDYTTAKRLDGATCEQILAFSTTLHGDDACGAYPLNGLLSVAREMGLSIELISACNSGDTAGDRHRVVGYASFALYE